MECSSQYFWVFRIAMTSKRPSCNVLIPIPSLFLGSQRIEKGGEIERQKASENLR